MMPRVIFLPHLRTTIDCSLSTLESTAGLTVAAGLHSGKKLIQKKDKDIPETGQVESVEIEDLSDMT